MIVELSLGSDLPYEATEIKRGSTVADVYKDRITEVKHNIFAARINNEIKPLDTAIWRKCKIQFLDMTVKQSYLIYQNSLVLLMLRAARDVVGSESIEVTAVLNDGIFLKFDSREVTAAEIDRINSCMKKIADDDLPIESKKFTVKEGRRILDDEGLENASKLLHKLADDETVRIYNLDGYSDCFYNYMVPSTGYLQYFELIKYRDGALLRFPNHLDQERIPEFNDEYMLYNALREQREWNRLLGVRYISDLNEKIAAGESRTIVQLSEALHDKKIVEIANRIAEEKKRVILILGPSSSGKTTFAHRLMIQMMVNGSKPLYVGTDDYFVERCDTPRDENGEYNFEGIEAIDVELFNKQINQLLAGNEVDMPVFDFIHGKKEYGKRITSLESGQPIVIEGIHAFNHTLTGSISDAEKFKIYTSPLTQINLDAHNRIPTTDTRIIRRMIRDVETRGHKPYQTLRDWDRVHNGEIRNIFPYTDEADAFFNTVHLYEIAVLKKHALPLLKQIKRTQPEYAEAQRLLRLFDFVDDMHDENMISGNSILREFIGGSIYR